MTEMEEFFKETGSRGGKAAAAKMTAKQRRERARKAGLAGGRGRPKVHAEKARAKRTTAKKARAKQAARQQAQTKLKPRKES